MQKYVFLFLLVANSIALHAQSVRSVEVRFQEEDEPPTKGGRSVYRIKFIRTGDELTAKYFTVSGKRKRLKKASILVDTVLQNFHSFKAKKLFSFNELKISLHELRAHTPTDFFSLPHSPWTTVDVDSFSFCLKFEVRKYSIIGGSNMSVTYTLTDGSKDEVQIGDDPRDDSFNLSQYLRTHVLLAEALPEQFPTFFDKEHLIQVLLQYKKVCECEGYYYQMYLKEHPEFTSEQRRNFRGWNFADYYKKIVAVKSENESSNRK